MIIVKGKKTVDYSVITTRICEIKHRKIANQLKGNSRKVIFYLFNQILENKDSFPKVVSSRFTKIQLFEMKITSKSLYVMTTKKFSVNCMHFYIPYEELIGVIKEINEIMSTIGLEVEVKNMEQYMKKMEEEININIYFSI